MKDFLNSKLATVVAVGAFVGLYWVVKALGTKYEVGWADEAIATIGTVIVSMLRGLATPASKEIE